MKRKSAALKTGKTTIQISAETHSRLRSLKGDFTFDQLLQLMLSLADEETLQHEIKKRERLFLAWQKDVASQLMSSKTLRRLDDLSPAGQDDVTIQAEGESSVLP